MNLNCKTGLKTLVLSAFLSSGLTAMAQSVIFPQQKQAESALLQVNDGVYKLSNQLFTAEFEVKDNHLNFKGCPGLGLLPGTELFRILLNDGSGKEIPASSMKLINVKQMELSAQPEAAKGALRIPGKAIEAHFTTDELDVTWRAVLRNGSHYLRTELEVTARRDLDMKGIVAMNYQYDNAFGKELPKVVGNTRGAVIANDKIFAGLETPMGINTAASAPTIPTTALQGLWSRQTTLKAGLSWNISAVVGLMAEGQARRSFLAYSERERAVPWRATPVYISWYELNIDRNNDENYTTNMNIKQCEDVIKHWNKSLFKKYKTGVKAFVFDDGWDQYGTWTFSKNFPNGFKEADRCARKMGAGIGAWLGPVGGYGQSGEYRRNFWKEKGGMQLSNPDYYKTFLDACSNMVSSYDFRFFKFDGISAQASAVGPDAGSIGDENAEAIINIEREVRKMQPNIFLNTTVGTWASPFWFQFTDAVWRQEADYATIGNQGSDRERWITYRDHLVYQNFVQNSPLCPINTLMTHGFILTKWGDTSKDMNYEGIVRELRCAFACGSGMVELYNDYALMDSINDGALWKDLAECISWQEANADVLPDIHWVGGHPWDGQKANVYGWAAWNARKAVLTLRNPAASSQNFKFTLREALDIPAYVKTQIVLTDAFKQDVLQGLKTQTPVDIDTPINVTLPASTVFIFNGIDTSAK